MLYIVDCNLLNWRFSSFVLKPLNRQLKHLKRQMLFSVQTRVLVIGILRFLLQGIKIVERNACTCSGLWLWFSFYGLNVWRRYGDIVFNARLKCRNFSVILERAGQQSNESCIGVIARCRDDIATSLFIAGDVRWTRRSPTAIDATASILAARKRSFLSLQPALRAVSVRDIVTNGWPDAVRLSVPLSSSENEQTPPPFG